MAKMDPRFFPESIETVRRLPLIVKCLETNGSQEIPPPPEGWDSESLALVLVPFRSWEAHLGTTWIGTSEI
jgi:hypothetical protein